MPVENWLYHAVYKKAREPYCLPYPQTVTLRTYHTPRLPTFWYSCMAWWVRLYRKFINTILGRIISEALIYNRINSLFSTVPVIELPIVIPHTALLAHYVAQFCQFVLKRLKRHDRLLPEAHLVHQIMIWQQATKGGIMVEVFHRPRDQDNKTDEVFFKEIKKVSRPCTDSYIGL